MATKADIRPDLMDEEVKSERWRNLYFRKTGETRLGETCFTGEEEANRHAAFVLSHLYIRWAGGHLRDCLGNPCIPIQQISHAIPMPVKE